MAHLNVEYAGLHLDNPIIAASSGLTGSIENLVELEKAGVGAVVLKSVFEEEIIMEMQQSMNQMTGKPYIFPETLNYMDEEPQEDIIRSYLNLVKEAKQRLRIPVIASINCISNQKWTYLAGEIEKAGADALEINLFSLPSDETKSSSEIEKEYIDVVKEIRKATKLPIMVKISPYFTSLGYFVKQLSTLKIQGIVLFNRFYSPDVDVQSREVRSSFITSHPLEYSMPLRWTSLLSAKSEVHISATTGVHSAETIIKLLLAGAKSVQVASVLYRDGLSSISGIKQKLLDWMLQNNFNSVKEFNGALAQGKLSNNPAWERTQFMKEFRHFVMK